MSKRNSIGSFADIRALAPVDPILAYALWLSDGYPQIFKMEAQFTTGAIDEEVDASTTDGTPGSTFCSDFVILGARFQIRRTLAFAGSIWKGQSDVNNALNSGIDMTLEAEGCPKFEIVPVPTAIELVADAPGTPDSCCAFPYGFVMPACSDLKAVFINRRALAPDELPTSVIVAVRGQSLGCNLCDVELGTAVQALVNAQFLAPDYKALQGAK